MVRKVATITTAVAALASDLCHAQGVQHEFFVRGAFCFSLCLSAHNRSWIEMLSSRYPYVARDKDWQFRFSMVVP